MSKKSKSTSPAEVVEQVEATDRFLDIDPLKLDEEWRGQPKLVYKYAKKLAKARLAVTGAKHSLELLEADLGLHIRNNPAAYSLTKITETVVATKVLQQQKYKDAQALLANAIFQQDVLSGAVSALEHRKKALEGSVSLLMIDYRSAPTAKGSDREAVDKVEKQFTRSGVKINRKGD